MTNLQKKIKEYKKIGAGSACFFDDLEVWGSKIYEPLFCGKYFITSELDAFGEERRFTVREFVYSSDDLLDIRDASEFLEFSTFEEAVEYVEELK